MCVCVCVEVSLSGPVSAGEVLATVETKQSPNSAAGVSPCGKFIACSGERERAREEEEEKEEEEEEVEEGV